MKAGLKTRVVQELKAYWIVAIYLWLFLGSITIYRRLILAEAGVPYLHYGISLIEALVIAKVVLIGRMFGFSRRFEERSLIVPVLYKTVVFGVLVILFGVVEHVVEGWIHGEGSRGGLHSLGELGIHELGARVLILLLAFIPFFAFGEIVRVLGAREIAALYFARRDAIRGAGRTPS